MNICWVMNDGPDLNANIGLRPSGAHTSYILAHPGIPLFFPPPTVTPRNAGMVRKVNIAFAMKTSLRCGEQLAERTKLSKNIYKLLTNFQVECI
jgi:hypothetical protein